MKEMPTLWKAVVSGQVVIYWDMVFAPPGEFKICLFSSTPVSLSPSDMAALNAAIGI